MDAFEVFDLVKELVGIGGFDRPSGVQLGRAYFLMGRLRDCGFSSAEVSLLSCGRWKSSAVRRFGKGSGVVDMSGRDDLLRFVGEFAREGGSLEELGGFREAERMLAAVGYGFESAAKLGRDLFSCKGNPATVSDLSSRLAAGGRTVGEVEAGISLGEKLEGMGLTREVQLDLFKAASEFGGPAMVLKGLAGLEGVKGLERRRGLLEAEVKGLEARVATLMTEAGMLEAQINQRKDMIFAANAATLSGFDVVSLSILKVLSEDFGGPYKVVDAFKKYPSLKALDDGIEAKKGEQEDLAKKVSAQAGLLNAFKYQVSEARREYEESQDIQLAVALLHGSYTVDQDRHAVTKLFSLILANYVAMMQRAWPPLDKEPELEETIRIADILATKLKEFIEAREKESKAEDSP